PGVMGNFVRVIPLIVIPVLLFSLIESQLVLPSHISHYHSPRPRDRMGWLARGWDSFFSGLGRGLDWVVNRLYRPTLERALRWRYLTLACGLAAMLLAVGLIGGGAVEVVFFPEIESDNVVI